MLCCPAEPGAGGCRCVGAGTHPGTFLAPSWHLPAQHRLGTLHSARVRPWEENVEGNSRPPHPVHHISPHALRSAATPSGLSEPLKVAKCLAC